MNNHKVIYSVSDLTHQIKLILEDSFPPIWVEGEVSNFKKHYSGHFYFTLKDHSAQISCVMWKSRTPSIPFELIDGMQLHLFGNLRVFEKSGRYQLDVIMMQEAGIGDYEDVLLINRNRNWIPVMQGMMKEKPTFFAVGAGG